MLIASNWCLNECVKPGTTHLILSYLPLRRSRSSTETPHQIHPHVHSFSNHMSTASSLLLPVTIPDVTPASLLAPGADFSYVAGDFLEVYGGRTSAPDARVDVPPEHRGQWAAIVTCFFVDTARNIMHYLETIRDLLADDGVWINLGPLLWHHENTIDRAKAEPSVELSLDELLELAQDMGFVTSVRAALAAWAAPFLVGTRAGRDHGQNDVLVASR